MTRDMTKEAFQVRLPKPSFVWYSNFVRIDVFLAKDFFSGEKWENEELRNLVHSARCSYKQYGDLPLEDAYDNKAGIYIARAQGRSPMSSKEEAIEWLSLRFISNFGTPESTEDLDNTHLDHVSIKDIVSKCLHDSIHQHPHPQEVISLSRLCGISSYAYSNIQRKAGVGSRREKLHWTALSFAIMNLVFLRDYKRIQNVKYISALLRPELLQKLLYLKLDDKSHQIHIEPAEKTLKFQQKIKLKRSELFYKYPGYYLNVEQLLGVIGDLLRQGQFSEETIRHYFGCESKEIFQQYSTTYDRLLKLRNLGNLLTEPNFIYKAKISGNTLRDIINERVDDGPSLFLMPRKIWRDEIKNFLLAAKI